MHIDVAGQRLVDGTTDVHLTRSELAVIGALSWGRITSMDMLIHAMHGDEETADSDNVAKVMIHRMRGKFLHAGLGKVIVTAWGRGYTLAQPIEMHRAAEEPIVIPAKHRADLERLLFSHPDHAAANRVLASFVVA